MFVISAYKLGDEGDVEDGSTHVFGPITGENAELAAHAIVAAVDPDKWNLNVHEVNHDFAVLNVSV